jgi:3-oxoadipate enol-lactonase
MPLPLEGRSIHYDLIGSENEPVVCMTHALTSASGMWAEQVPPLLAAGFRVLRLDMRGHGGSDPGVGDYTLSGLAGDIALVLDSLGSAHVHYIGLSMGGVLGQVFAFEHRDRLVSAMWCDTMLTRPGTPEDWQQRVDAVSAANSVAPLADSVEGFLTDAFKARNPRRYKQIRDMIIGTTPAGFLGCVAAVRDFDFAAFLPSVRLPVLVVCGAADTDSPPEGNRRIASLVPGARYEEIADARHMPNVEKPDVFNRIMLGWLQAQRG